MKLNQFLSVLSASGVLLFSSSAYAATLNHTIYYETNAYFTWLLTWDGQSPAGGYEALRPQNASKWDLTFIVSSNSLNPSYNSLGVIGKHISKAHSNDSDSGNEFTVVTNSTRLTTATSPRSLDTDLVVHQLNPTSLGNHFDSYTLAYTRASEGGTVNFQVNGFHLETPEPITTLLGSGLALGFGGLLKREYSRKQKKLKDKAII